MARPKTIRSRSIGFLFPGQSRLDNHLWTRYRIRVKDYEDWFVFQGGRCGLCFQVPEDTKRLAVDHCHDTGRIRGLLCRRCNSSLERLETFGPEWMRRAENWLTFDVS